MSKANLHHLTHTTGEIPKPRSLCVLCYHSISDLSGAPIIENYGTPPEQFRGQLDILLSAGFRFVDADEFLRILQGKADMPQRAVLLTFDDCYQDLLDNALPILKERRIPAMAFAVSKRLGVTNKWDTAIGAPELRLLDEDGLLQLENEGVAIGAHSRTHPQLNHVSPEELSNEIAGSIDDLESVGLNRPGFFAYPYGAYNQQVIQATRQAGLKGAFTIDAGYVQPGQNRYKIPRIEILREDTSWKFRSKVS